MLVWCCDVNVVDRACLQDYTPALSTITQTGRDTWGARHLSSSLNWRRVFVQTNTGSVGLQPLFSVSIHRSSTLPHCQTCMATERDNLKKDGLKIIKLLFQHDLCLAYAVYLCLLGQFQVSWKCQACARPLLDILTVHYVWCLQSRLSMISGLIADHKYLVIIDWHKHDCLMAVQGLFTHWLI